MTHNPTATNAALVQVNKLSFRYQDDTNQNNVLNNLTFSLSAGRVYCFLGENGAGKTTLINLLLGIMDCPNNQISVLGQKPASKEVRARVGAMMQVAGLPENIKVIEHLKLFQSYYLQPLSLTKALQLSGLEQAQNKTFSQLSGGQKQRLLFALALIGDPDIVFLDEPSVAMDVKARQVLWRAIRELKALGKTVILTTHYMEEAEALSDHLFVLKQGEIVAQGSAAELKASMLANKVSFTTRCSTTQIENALVGFTYEYTNGVIHIHCEDPVVLLKQIFSAKLSCENLTVAPLSLEQTFISLTNKEQCA